jgi:hypothetical protein
MQSDAELIVELRRIALAPKLLAVTPGWQEQPHKSNARVLKFIAALEIDAVVIEGLQLYGRTLKSPADQNLTFQLSYRFGGIWHQLHRLDWRPLKPHTDNIGPVDGRLSFDGSSCHLFDDNAKFGIKTLRPGPRGNLPRARPLDPEPANFNDLLGVVVRVMHIDNAHKVPLPPWDLQGFLL